MLKIIYNPVIKRKKNSDLSLSESLPYFLDAQLQDFYLPHVDQRSIDKLTGGDIANVKKLFHAQNLQIPVAYAGLQDAEIGDDASLQSGIASLTLACVVANELQIPNLIIAVPHFHDYVESEAQLIFYLTALYKIAKKAKIQLHLAPNLGHEVNVMLLLLEKLRHFQPKIVLDMAACYHHNLALGPILKLFKDQISYLIVSDENADESGQLLGYGELNLLPIFHQLHRQGYQGDFIVQNNLYEFFKAFDQDTVKNQYSLLNLFKKKNNDALYIFRKRLNAQKENLTYSDVLRFYHTSMLQMTKHLHKEHPTKPPLPQTPAKS
jgi:sugar phosphate isomerase/epimerase